jgi:hypothetical protein
MKRLQRALAFAVLVFAAAALGLARPAVAATITIQVMDGVGEGFNDTTAFVPIGGNPATTLGQARLNVFNQAAQLWGALITSNANIVVEAKFDPQTCTANSGTLGAAGPKWVFRDFPGATVPNVYYAAALANALHGSVISATSAGDITATFNSTVGGDPNCLLGQYFYLGYDHQLTGHNDGKTYVADLLSVVLHEISHGLGFLTLTDQNGLGVADSQGTRRLGIYDQFVYDEGTGLFWKDMTAAQRATSANGGGATGGNTLLAWNSARVNAQASREVAGLTPQGHVRLNAPATYDAASSVSHWDSSASPDLLMEPRYSRNTGSHTDLTTCVFQDIGWAGARCPDDLQAVAQSVNVTAGVAQAITLAAANTNGATVGFSVTVQPTHGTLGALAGAQATYTPAAGYTGADQFSYTVNDALSVSRAAVVSITVQAPALLAAAQSLAVTSGNALAVTLSATGGGGGAISYAITALPMHGTLGAVTGAQVSYTPAAGYVGADAFSFHATTSTSTSNDATVSITVNAAAAVAVGGSTGGGSTGGGSTVGGSSGGGGAVDGYALAALALALGLQLAAAGRPSRRPASVRPRAAARLRGRR